MAHYFMDLRSINYDPRRIVQIFKAHGVTNKDFLLHVQYSCGRFLYVRCDTEDPADYYCFVHVKYDSLRGAERSLQEFRKDRTKTELYYNEDLNTSLIGEI